jgi:coenzyme F420-reducing hydrogenase delta subunit
MNIENNGSKEDRIEYQQRSRQEALEFASVMKEARENLKVVNASKKKGRTV